MAPRVVVVGGGIAGLSVLAALARAGAQATLYEREAVIGAHASGRNAAIHRSLEQDATTAALVRRSRALMEARTPGGHLARTGLVLALSDPDAAERWAHHAADQNIGHRLLERDALCGRAPHLAAGELRAGVWVDDGGVLDIHAMLVQLSAEARQHGAVVRTATGVAAVSTAAGRVSGVRLDSGETVAADHVVLCAGAWAQRLGAACWCPLPLSPKRRHLVQLAVPQPVSGPVVWRVDRDEMYLRPEGNGVLCSPCDQTVMAPPAAGQDPPRDPTVLEQLAGKLTRTAPALAGAAVRHYWSCLRTFAPDRELVAGPDPRLPGLHWLSALGGRGMSVGPGVGEQVAAALLQDRDISPSSLGVARFFNRPDGQ